MDESTTAKDLLEPMNLHNAIEFEELLRQRVICRWDCSRSDVETWRESADAHSISLFWIVPAATFHLPTPQRLVGHIGVRKLPEAPYTEPEQADEPVQHLFHLFILPEHRLGGLGRKSVEALESWAQVPPYGSLEYKSMTLNAISRRYIEDDAEEWRPFYVRLCESMGIDHPVKGRGNEDCTYTPALTHTLSFWDISDASFIGSYDVYRNRE